MSTPIAGIGTKTQNLRIKENNSPLQDKAEKDNETEADPLKSSLYSGIDSDEEDPYYDNQRDEKDEKWTDKHITGGIDRSMSDAVLNCPSCFVLLCVDCQRHEKYSDQYRAMFVANCKVNYYPQFIYNRKQRNTKRLKAKWEREEVENTSLYLREELFCSVVCANCEIEVAVFDSNEVYHFFNVITGY